MKYVTRILILTAIFVGAVWFMGKNMKEDKFSLEKTIEMEESKYPIVSIGLGEEEINVLYGYTGNITASNFRTSITPLGTDQTMQLYIRENDVVVKKVNYEVIDVTTTETLSSGSISAIENTAEGKTVPLKLEGALEVDKEYALDITLITDTSKKIHYFTRVKVQQESYVAKQLAFIQGFHEATFDKTKMEEYTLYLEATDASTPRSLTHVTIKSPLDNITWGTMNPTIISKVVPTIKEVIGDTLCVQLRYLVRGQMKDAEGAVLDNERVYDVNEYYRVRFVYGRMYVMQFDRTLDGIYDMSSFDPTKLDSKAKAMNLGFVKEAINVESSQDSSKMAFVNHGTLWYYDLAGNKAVNVYSLMNQEVAYYHGGYYDNNIRILDVFDNGNMNFLVYGYINRGDYEGRLGLILYKYYAESNRIEEQVFVPVEYPYEILEKKLDGLYYLSGVDTFYFAMDGVIYSYSMVTRKLEVIAEDVTNDSFLLSEEGQFLAWQNSSNPEESTEIHILKLETEERLKMEAPSGKNIILLENSNTNLVYGYVNTKDILVEEDGTVVTPMYQVDIVDTSGQLMKRYTPRTGYVSDVKQMDARLQITLIKKNDGGKSYSANGSDFIVNKIENTTKTITSYTVEVEKDLKRVLIALPNTFEAKKKPKIRSTVNTIITEDTTIHIQERETKEVAFYAYNTGKLVDSYKRAAEAIAIADPGMGVVTDNKNRLVWVKEETRKRSSLTSFPEVTTGNGVTSMGACVSMLLQYNYVQADAQLLSSSNRSMYELLEQNLGYTPVNLTGCNLSQVLYYVGEKRPVIAMKNGTNAVVIIGYDETSITYVDPAAKTTTTMGKTAATTMFEEAGNVFLSYVK